MAVRALALTVVLVANLAACGDSRLDTDTAALTTATAPLPATSDVALVTHDRADLHLWISNQSFADDPVDVTVSIDGSEIIAQPFAVEGQHNWVLFPLALPPGPHVLEVTSGTGATLQEEFTLPEEGRRHAVLDYWDETEDGGPLFTWQIQIDPIGFA